MPAFKLLIVGNHAPVLNNVDEAARRRFLIVPFVTKPAVPDRQLEVKLKAEWPAILQWAVDGCLAWQTGGLARAQSVVEATREYFSDQDLVAQFLEDRCDVDGGNTWKTATAGDLFAAWVDFMRAAGEPTGSQKAFSSALLRHGLVRHRGTGGVRLFAGVQLRRQNMREAA